MSNKADTDLIIERMKIRLLELQEQMPVIAELEEQIKQLEELARELTDDYVHDNNWRNYTDKIDNIVG